MLLNNKIFCGETWKAYIDWGRALTSENGYRALQDQLPPGGGGKFRARFHSRLGNPCKFACRSQHQHINKLNWGLYIHYYF